MFNQFLDQAEMAFESRQHQHTFVFVVSQLGFGFGPTGQQLGHLQGRFTHRQHQGWNTLGVDRVGIKTTLKQGLNGAHIVRFKRFKEVLVSTGL